VFGKMTPINKNRGHLIDLDENTKALVTVHPSYLLRLPDERGQGARVRALRRRSENGRGSLTKISPCGVIGFRPARFPKIRTDPFPCIKKITVDR
jgi:hypothetical protein